MVSSPLTTISVHSDVLSRLRRLKIADQTWDEFLLEMADDYVPRAWVEELERRAKDPASGDVPADQVFEEARSAHRARR
jgi:hypothetical protein